MDEAEFVRALDQLEEEAGCHSSEVDDEKHDKDGEDLGHGYHPARHRGRVDQFV